MVWVCVRGEERGTRNSPVRGWSLCPAWLSASGGDEPASATLRSRIFRVADAREDCDSGALHKRI